MSTKTNIQEAVPLSDSILFDIHKNYFRKNGIDSWKKNVPYYVTSHALFVNQVATLTFTYLIEAFYRGDITHDEPLYCLELGAGAGKFMYMFLNTLLPMLETSPLKDLSFIYIGSDFSENIVSYWDSHHQFQPFIKNGSLDFALYDAEKQQDIRLRKSGTLLKNLKNPLLVIANYVFDSLVHDAFHTNHGQLELSLAATYSKSDDYENNPEDLALSFSKKNIDTHYYKDTGLNRILTDYLTDHDSSTFLLPTGAVSCLNHVHGLSQKGAIVISHDKGHVEMESCIGITTPQFVTHGSISLMVNYDALCRYFGHKEGEGVMGDPVYGLKTCLIATGSTLFNFPLTKQALVQCVNTLPSDQFLGLKNLIDPIVKQLSTKDILAYLQFCMWDPKIVSHCTEPLLELIHTLTPSQILLLKKGLQSSERLIYDFSDDYYYFDLARVWHDLAHYEKSRDLYLHSMQVQEEDEFHWYNLALAYYKLGNHEKTKAALGEAKRVNPGYEAVDVLMKELKLD